MRWHFWTANHSLPSDFTLFTLMPPSPQNQKSPEDTTTEKPPRLSPIGVMWLIFGILTARWCWIAGITDYGWIYELGMRVWQGEAPYRDFISTLPQLTSYTLVPFLVLTKGNLWGFAIHLYLWWLASLWGGLLVARRLGMSVALQSASVLLAACVSFPAAGMGHAYSYAGTFFFELFMLSLLRHHASPTRKPAVLAGIWTGLAILAKQNIGLAAVAFGLLYFTKLAAASSPGESRVRNLLTFLGSIVAVFGLPFLYFAGHAGGREVLAQMFLDAGAGKGGVVGLVVHALPMMFFKPEMPDRELWSLVVSGIAFLAFLLGYASKAKIGEVNATPVIAHHPNQSTSSAWLGFSLLIIAVVSALSWIRLPALKAALDGLISRYSYGYIGPLIALLYSNLAALSVIFLAYVWAKRHPEAIIPALALPIILFGHEISSHGYLPYSAPLAIPLALFIFERHLVYRHAARFACLLAAAFIFTHSAFAYPTDRLGTFEGLQRLPDRSRFACLWAEPSYATSVIDILTNVAPLIHGHSTLWFSTGGPHLAFGGNSVRAVALLHVDTYNVRSEPDLMAAWNREPPEYVFLGTFVPCVGSRWFTPAALGAWLSQNYDRVWRSGVRESALWKRKPASAPGST